MRPAILLLVLSAVVLGSCTSAYKTGQTPDDVYFSPPREHDEYVNVKENDRKYQSDDEYYDDAYLRMKVHNRVMWSDLDDYYYYNPRYSYSYYNSCNWNNPWNPIAYWNYSYNPYCSPVVYVGYSKVVYSQPRMANLNTYNRNLLTNNNYTNPKGISNYGGYSGSTGSPKIIKGYTPSSSNSGSGAGNLLRNIFNGSSSSNNSSYSPSSSSRSSSSSSSSSGGSSGGSAPVRRF